MTDETPPVDDMNYDALTQDALRGVIRAAIERAATADGIPGNHHFYITFGTRAAGVSVPADILAKYPEEMTVVLQHQYWDLTVDAEQFSVMLKFGGMPKVLKVPFKAVSRFYDPSVQFLLQFEPAEAQSAVVEDFARNQADAPTSPTDDKDGPKVVSLDQFRKK